MDGTKLTKLYRMLTGTWLLYGVASVRNDILIKTDEEHAAIFREVLSRHGLRPSKIFRVYLVDKEDLHAFPDN